jgi:hypothetical protein
MTGHLFWVGDPFKFVSDYQRVDSHNLPNSGYRSDELIKLLEMVVPINELLDLLFHFFELFFYLSINTPIVHIQFVN